MNGYLITIFSPCNPNFAFIQTKEQKKKNPQLVQLHKFILRGYLYLAVVNITTKCVE